MVVFTLTYGVICNLFFMLMNVISGDVQEELVQSTKFHKRYQVTDCNEIIMIITECLLYSLLQ